MKRTLYILPLLLITLLGLVGCTPKSLEIDVPQLNPQVVVASQVIPNQFMVVGLTRSFGALEEGGSENIDVEQDLIDRILVSDATVTISYLGQTDTLFQIESGVYASLTTPQYTNAPYTLEVYDPQTNTTVMSTATMLEQVDFDTVYPVAEIDGSDTTLWLDYTITDPAGDNWYMINVYKNSDGGTQPEFDLNSYFNNGSNLLLKTEILSDKEFAGSVYNDTLLLNNLGPNDSVAVSVSNINQEYYEFLALRKQSSNWFSQVTNEPINYPTNVTNGLGFFNTHYPGVRFFAIIDWL